MTTESQALVMANARKLIKRSRMTNVELYSELFGTGFFTAIKRCQALGLDPHDNKTSYHEMMEYIT